VSVTIGSRTLKDAINEGCGRVANLGTTHTCSYRRRPHRSR